MSVFLSACPPVVLAAGTFFSLIVTVPSEGENAKKLRPVLDAIHERSTGNLRVRVNDGREMTATGTSVVDVAITHIGVVLFNPKTVVSAGFFFFFFGGVA